MRLPTHAKFFFRFMNFPPMIAGMVSIFEKSDSTRYPIIHIPNIQFEFASRIVFVQVPGPLVSKNWFDFFFSEIWKQFPENPFFEDFLWVLFFRNKFHIPIHNEVWCVPQRSFSFAECGFYPCRNSTSSQVNGVVSIVSEKRCNGPCNSSVETSKENSRIIWVLYLHFWKHNNINSDKFYFRLSQFHLSHNREKERPTPQG